MATKIRFVEGKKCSHPVMVYTEWNGLICYCNANDQTVNGPVNEAPTKPVCRSGLRQLRDDTASLEESTPEYRRALDAAEGAKG